MYKNFATLRKSSVSFFALSSFRIVMAIVGGFVLTSLFAVWLPELLFSHFGVDKIRTFLWCLLFAFALYCVLIIWVISTHHLLRSSLIMLLIAGVLWLSIEPASAATSIETKETQL
ncbi:hypothetical protein CA267_007910 [Alteromonas pelagimontana]|uniref:DUF3649 domain-containing protein n=1 Tax=Alteromonas pelagimontana TaxID=1858656 RepID=A0A6M4MCY7_9ALTE|nr:hypothetical protein [Alteromonas pelagimontana]QJR80708.1 hypothetical protein CA267_007910 [Alteromonas pelagimontana]